MSRKSNLKEVPFGREKYDPEPDVSWGKKTVSWSDWPERYQMMEYVGYGGSNYEWRPNEPFEDTLRFTGFERGRSAARAIWISEKDGTAYPMFLMDLAELLRTAAIADGKVSGRFMARKQGANYGLLRIADA